MEALDVDLDFNSMGSAELEAMRALAEAVVRRAGNEASRLERKMALLDKRLDDVCSEEFVADNVRSVINIILEKRENAAVTA